jgi:hypothetical protein
MKGKNLVCESCWWKTPTKDRSTFVRLFIHNQNNAPAMRGIGQKIIKGLKAKLAPTRHLENCELEAQAIDAQRDEEQRSREYNQRREEGQSVS